MLRYGVLLSMCWLTACAGGARTAGEVQAAYRGPIRSADVEHGREVFENVCNSCHAGGAPNLQGLAWDAGRVRQQVREGGGRMPSIAAARLSDDDLEAVLAYMTTIGAVEGELPAPSTGGDEPASVEEPEGGEAPTS